MRAGLTVAGIQVEVRAPRGQIETIVADRYAPFLGAVKHAVCSIEFAPSGEIHGAPNPPMAKVHDPTQRHVKIVHTDFDAELDLEGSGFVTTASNPFTIDHFFRLLFGLLAPRNDALMLHACGVVTQGRAEVFAGQSGAGKSTLASLAGTRPLLSDEHVMVRRQAQRWNAASTPFWGSYSVPGPARQAPLARIWELRQWPQHQVRPLDRLGCLRLALEHSVLPSPDAAFKALVFGVAADLADDVPAAELRFTPTADVWEHIDERHVA